MRSSWQARFLLPVAQILAEGGWLAVVYAAVQALSNDAPAIGPLELAILVWVGLAWGRRARWRSPAAEAVGLPLIALLGGVAGWLLDPQVRGLLVDGQVGVALSTHVAGWIGAVAVWRGETHRSIEDDDLLAEQLLRWAVPGLAIPWLIGHRVTSGQAEAVFTSAAFMGTLVFIGSALTAMGLARLEAVRVATGSDWRANRAWLVLIAGVALAVTLVGIPVAAYLGVPARALLVTVAGPLRMIVLALVLLATPLILVITAATQLIGPLLPSNITLPRIDLSGLQVDPGQIVSDLPTFVFYAVVVILATIELLVLLVILYLRWKERRHYRVAVPDPFEERAIVIPAPSPGLLPGRARRRRPKRDPSDPAGAYLLALEALEEDGRWPRRPSESPAAHVTRVRSAGLGGAALPRLAGAYQLVRYAGARLPATELRRAPGRLAALRERLRRAS